LSHSSGELEELFGSIRDGELTMEQAVELERRLVADPALRQDYLEYIDLCSLLRRYEGFGSAGDSVTLPDEFLLDAASLPRRVSFWPGRSSRRTRYAVAASAVMALVLSAVALTWWSIRATGSIAAAARDRDRSPIPPVSTRGVASLNAGERIEIGSSVQGASTADVATHPDETSERVETAADGLAVAMTHEDASPLIRFSAGDLLCDRGWAPSPRRRRSLKSTASPPPENTVEAGAS
jgi:hypothetical protein